MLKKVLIAMALLLCFAQNADAQWNRGYVHHTHTVVDMTGRIVTDISEVYIYLPDTTTTQTIYLDRGLTNAITIPMTTTSTNTGLDQDTGTISWWGQDSFDFKIGNGTVTTDNAYTSSFSSSQNEIVFPYFLRTYDSQALLDAQSITFGTDLDWVINSAVANTLTFTPATADTSVFSVGTTSYPADFKLWGATSAYDLYWDASEDDLIAKDNVTIAVGTGSDYTLSHNGTTTTVGGAWSASGIVTLETDVLFDGTYDISYDDNRYQLLFEDNAILAIGGAHDAAGDTTLSHDGSNLSLLSAIADEGFLIGGTTYGFDITYAFETAGQIRTDYDADFLNFTDDMEIRFGTGASADGDIAISSNSSNVLQIEQVVADTGTITVGADGAGMDVTFFGEEAGDYMKWDGTSASQLILYGADSSNTLLAITGADVTLNSDTVTITHSGTGAALKMTSSEADTQLLEMVSAANQTTWLGVVDGATGNWIGADDIGMLHLKADTALAHAGASQLQVVNTATPITAAEGFLARFVSTGTAQTNASAVEIEVPATQPAFATNGIVAINGQDAAGAAILQVAGIGASGNADAMTITNTGTGDNLQVTVGSATGVGLNVVAATNQTTSAVKVDGATGSFLGAANVGMVHLTNDGALADVASSLLYIANSGVPTNDSRGSSLRIVDTGNAAAGTAGYAAYISATDATVEALMIDDGNVLIDEDLDVGGVITTDGINASVVLVTDAATYAVLAANTGMVHVIPDASQGITISLPAEAAGLNYKFIYGGAAADASNHIITSGSDTNFFYGGVAFIDVDAGAGADELSVVYSNGSSNSSLTINVIAAGTYVEFFCDGTHWYINGTIISATAPTIAGT